MSLVIGDNFSFQGAKPLDARLKYDTLANMKAVADATMYEGCLAYCEATDKTYQWKSTNTVDADTGKWREFETGGGSASALSDLTDTNISTPTDGQVLQYDGTNDEWVNGDAPKGVVQGYYKEAIEAVNNAVDFLELVNLVRTDTDVTVDNESAIEVVSASSYVVFVYPRDKHTQYPSVLRYLFSDSPLTITLQYRGEYNSYSLYYKATDNSVHTVYTLSGSNYIYGATSLVTSTTSETGYKPYLSTNFDDAYKCAQIYVSNNVTIAESNLEANTQIISTHEDAQFYLDSAFTQLVNPNEATLYNDIPTRYLYAWNGMQYVNVGKDETTDPNAYHVNDNTGTIIDDADYFPFYDSSENAKGKSLWSNIKSVLKTYFDSIYSTFSGSYNDLSDKPTIVAARETPTSGGTTLSLVNTGDMYSWNNKANAPTVLSQTLSAGSTSVTFSDVPTSGNYLITPYNSVVGLDYDNISQSGSSVTVTYPSQSSATTVYLKIESV